MSPYAPLSPCSVPTCPERAVHGRGKCRKHLQEYDRQRYQAKGGRFRTRQFKAKREEFLARPENRWCWYCAQRGVRTPATVLEHVQAHKGSQALHNDSRNWRPSCGTCNRIKANQFEGGAFKRRPDDKKTREKSLSSAGSPGDRKTRSVPANDFTGEDFG